MMTKNENKNLLRIIKVKVVRHNNVFVDDI